MAAENYQPTSRRPIADMFRRPAGATVDWCVQHDVHPNTVSYCSVVAAALAATCFHYSGRIPALLIPAAGFCYLRLWFNMLDGMVALKGGKASRTGEIVNELPDRVSDVLIFVGVAHSGLCNPFYGYWGAICALLVAYVGTLGQALGVQREFSGLMSKPWRMVTLHIGSWAMLFQIWFGSGYEQATSGFTLLDWTLVVVYVGSFQTIVLRLFRIIRAIKAAPPRATARDNLPPPPLPPPPATAPLSPTTPVPTPPETGV